MRTIFGLFSTYEDAKAAIQDLSEQEFAINEMNAIIQKDIAANILQFYKGMHISSYSR